MTEKIYRAHDEGKEQGEGAWTWWAFSDGYAKAYGRGILIESEIDIENLENALDLRPFDFDADRDMDSEEIVAILKKAGLDEVEIEDGIFRLWQLQDVGDYASCSNFAEKVLEFDYILWYEDGHATIGIRNKA